MAQHSHVPKFGNWDSDSVPYTAYFEHARREKVESRIMINPNDPMENPEAFLRVGENVDADEVHGYSHVESSLEKGSHRGVLRNHTPPPHVHNRFRGSQGRVTSEFTSEQTRFDHSVTNTSSQSDHKRDMSKGCITTKTFSSFNDHSSHHHHQGTAIPKFGSWDVTNPKSGEGYTVIFDKIKEERQIKSSNVSSISSTPPLNNCSNIKNRYGGPSFSSKYCCCLFPSESK